MKALVVLSGGQDSTTCLALAIQKYGRDNVYAVTFDYGQRHRIEIASAQRIASIAGIGERHEVILVPGILKGSSPLVDGGASVERYESAATLPGGLEKTFVPMRNQFFLTLAANRGVLIGLTARQQHNDLPSGVDIITGVSQEDYGGYPDCREEFIDLLTVTMRRSLDDKSLPWISIVAPLMHLDKQATVNLALAIDAKSPDIQVREMLAWSHTCYNGMVPPCGSCHACLLRQKGFDLAGVEDPLLTRLKIPHGAGAGAVPENADAIEHRERFFRR